ncbi:hypothetical protein AD998_18260 [bacterium 336/3]|nr:hypothetical protein AD998_18260 [bacterium 336/3]
MKRLFYIILTFLIWGCQSPNNSSSTDNSIPMDSSATMTILKNTQINTDSINKKPIAIDTTNFIIQAGQGVNGLNLNMTVQSAIEKCRKQSDFNRSIACGETTTYYTNRFFFLNNKIVVLSTTTGGNKKNFTDSQIEEIGILYPANAITDKGIHLKTDNLYRIIKTYGKPEKEETHPNNIYLNYYSKGISFDCNRHNNSIERIAIYKKGEEPDFYYWNRW